jgi:hypothetical protein
MTISGNRPALLVLVRHGESMRNVAKKRNRFCFRYVLEGWTYEEAEQRFRTEAIRNCSVTAYERDESGHRLRLMESATVYWE